MASRLRIYSRLSLGALLLGAATLAPAATLEAMVADEAGQPMADAVVVAVPRFAHRAPPPRPEIVEQVGKEFVPRINVVLAGTAVSFPNRDEVKHHVYSFSLAKKFEIQLYQGTPASPVVLDRPGLVVLGCNIHDWMAAYIYVSESPFFAKTDAGGRARLLNLPAGAYDVRVWHPASQAAETETRRGMTISEPSAHVAWQIKSRAEARIRRAPVAGSGGYR